MKLLVETAGPFQLMDHDPYQIVYFDRPTVIERSPLIERHTLTGQVIVLAQLADTASDEDWVAHSKEAGDDREFSIESYKSQHALEQTDPRLEQLGKQPRQNAPGATYVPSASGTTMVDNTSPADQVAQSYPSEPRKPGELSQTSNIDAALNVGLEDAALANDKAEKANDKADKSDKGDKKKG